MIPTWVLGLVAGLAWGALLFYVAVQEGLL